MTGGRQGFHSQGRLLRKPTLVSWPQCDVSSTPLRAYPLRGIFSFCALSEVPECLAFSGDCWLFQDAIVLSPSHVVPSEMRPEQVCILVLRIWTPGHVSLDTSGHLSMNWFGCTWTPLCQCEWDRAKGCWWEGLLDWGGTPMLVIWLM